MRYCVVMYDVPVDRKAAYTKLGKILRDIAVMQTWSCYLIPLSERDAVARLIEDMNEDDTRKVEFRILKFDDAEEDALAQAVVAGIQKQLSDARKLLHKRIDKVKKQLDEGDPETEILDLDKSIRHAHGQAKKAIDRAAALAIRFEQTNNLTDAIEAYAKSIESVVEQEKAEAAERKTEAEKTETKADKLEEVPA